MNDFQKNKKVFNNFLKTHVLSHKFDKQLDPLFHEIQAFEKGITSLFGNTSQEENKLQLTVNYREKPQLIPRTWLISDNMNSKLNCAWETNSEISSRNLKDSFLTRIQNELLQSFSLR